MIKTLQMSLKIDMTYAINSFIYHLKRLPILKDLMSDHIYQNQLLKKLIRILAIVLSMGRFLLFRFLYFFVIYWIACFLAPTQVGSAFVHIYFVFAIIGLFLNNKLLTTSTKKYFSIILFHMDAKLYMKSSLWWDLFSSLILNSIFIILFGRVLSFPFWLSLSMIFFSFFVRIIGEALNLWFYRKWGYLWYHNLTAYFLILGILLVCSFTPYFDLFIPNFAFYGVVLLSGICSIFSYYYLLKINDYKLIYQRLNTKNQAMNSDAQKAYSRQMMVAMKEKDQWIDSKKIQGKKGYDLFNTIFFGRHKEILLRSARNFAIFIFFVVVILLVFVLAQDGVAKNVHDFLLNHLGWFVLIMYFINRGSIITQAMFYNCDHAMLTYNFYREPKVLLNLFKKRLLTVTKVNLLPASVLALGILLLLYFTGGTTPLNYVMIPVFILVLSIFFSVHYLVIYYLLQPYNQDMQMKKVSYSFVSMLTYLVTYWLHDLEMSSLTFSMVGLMFTISYIFLSLFLVYKKAPETFKICS